jgi:hypothetical protein
MARLSEANLHSGRLARTNLAGPATVVLITMNREKINELTLLVHKPITIVGEIL